MPRAEEEHGTTASFVSDHNDHRHDCDDVVGGFIKMLRLDREGLNSAQVEKARKKSQVAQPPVG